MRNVLPHVAEKSATYTVRKELERSTPWPYVPLTEAVDLNPKLDRGSVADELEVSFVPMAAVEAETGVIDLSTVRKYADVKKGYTYFRDGDVLFAKITPCMENGKIAIARELRNGIGFGSTEFHVLRPREGIDARYVYHFIASAQFRAEAAHHMTGAVGQQRVPVAFLEQSEIPLPPINEQRRIAEEMEKQFSRLDRAVTNLDQLKSKLKRYKAAVLKAAVEGHLVSNEAELANREGRAYQHSREFLKEIAADRVTTFDRRRRKYRPAIELSKEPYGLPEGWSWATWDQLTVWITYGFTRPMPHVEQGVPIVTAKHVADGQINFTTTHKTPRRSFDALSDKDRPELGDLLITKDGAIGRAAIVDMVSEFCINQSVAVAWLASGELNRKFLKLVIESPISQARIADRARGVAIQHLSITDLAKMPVPMPPQAEQERIVAEVDRCLSLVDEIAGWVDTNLRRAGNLRQEILRQELGLM